MSTTFDVYTATDNIPSYYQVLEESNRFLVQHLKRYGIDRRFTLDVALYRKEGNDVVVFDKSASAIWPEDCCA